MPDLEYNRLDDMFRDIAEYACDNRATELFWADDINHGRHRITTDEGSVTWSISARDVKYPDRPHSEKGQEIKELIQTGAGKEMLIRSLNGLRLAPVKTRKAAPTAWDMILQDDSIEDA